MQICKKIHRGRNAEQYHAEKKCKEAVAVAVEACADDTQGQKCYICLEAVHPRTGEGLVRGCACGDRLGVYSPELGVVHVSCLAEQATLLVAEARENNLWGEEFDARFQRWVTCGLCEQQYHGVVACALGWACWRAYLGRSEGDFVRRSAITQLGNGLSAGNHHADALFVGEAELSMERRLGASEINLLVTQSNLASTYTMLGQDKDAVRLQQDVYSGTIKLHGVEHEGTLREACNLATLLHKLERFEEVKSMMRKTTPVARRVLGAEHTLTLSLSEDLFCATLAGDSSAEEKREALQMLEDTLGVMRRVFGTAHPDTLHTQKVLEFYRGKYAEG